MIGYLDLPSGISGDMFLGCLVDAGWPIEQLRATIATLLPNPQDVSVESRDVMKGALRATLVEVSAADQKAHRHLHSVAEIIGNSELPATVKERSIAVFTRLAHAEAKVHGTSVEKIHFHEVGALDAIVDIVGVVAGVHELGIEALYASPLPMGHGWTNSQHGQIPLPAPATLELLAAANAPTRPAPGPGELVTPTGAALVCELAKFQQPAMRLQRIAMGAGQRETPWPNVARLWLGTQEAGASSDDSSAATILQMETNIDDMNPQLYAPLSERLLAAGALDVWLVPMQMKKSRPGVTLAVLLPAAKKHEIADIILRETTTLGVRVHPVSRFEADREMQQVATQFGIVQVKLKKWSGQIYGAMPEYEDCRRLAEQKNVALRTVYDAALAKAHAQFMSR
jgi:uncharacterized protein (TIGR00299 family) protein